MPLPLSLTVLMHVIKSSRSSSVIPQVCKSLNNAQTRVRPDNGEEEHDVSADGDERCMLARVGTQQAVCMPNNILGFIRNQHFAKSLIL